MQNSIKNSYRSTENYNNDQCGATKSFQDIFVMLAKRFLTPDRQRKII